VKREDQSMAFPFLRRRAERRSPGSRKRLGYLLVLDELEDRRLLSNLFDAPWRAFDTGAFPGTAFGPNSIAVGDLNGDGRPDVVVGNGHFGEPGISVLFNQSDGVYAPPASYS